MKICLIGNSGIKSNDKGGQTTKLRLYKKIIIDEGFDLFFVDLENFFYHPLYILRKIKKGIKECDRVVLVSGERACKLLIPYINKYKLKYRKIFVLPLIGISVLHYSLKKMSDYDVYKFFTCGNNITLNETKIRNELRKIDCILPETVPLLKAFKYLYKLNNCFLLENFRELPLLDTNSSFDGYVLKIIYLSRVIEKKGILDLLLSLKMLSINYNFSLDIFGVEELNKDDKSLFYSLLNDSIEYKGSIDDSVVVNVLSSYDLLVFPTKYIGEGTPGVISESLIAGTPILTSNFPNAPYLLKDGYDSIFYEMFNVEDLKAKLEWCINNKDKIRAMRKNCLESSKKFTYEYNRKDFLKYVCGVEDEK